MARTTDQPCNTPRSRVTTGPLPAPVRARLTPLRAGFTRLRERLPRPRRPILFAPGPLPGEGLGPRATVDDAEQGRVGGQGTLQPTIGPPAGSRPRRDSVPIPHTGSRTTEQPDTPSLAPETDWGSGGLTGMVVAASGELRVRNWPLALGIVVIGMFMSVLDISIVNVAIPTIQNQFGVSSSGILWITTGYTLALGVIVPVSGWLGEKFGLSRVYALSVLAFGLGSALCGLAWDLPSLVAFRIVQAIPGGILAVITLTMIYRIVPKEKIGIGIAAYGLAAVFAPATGPTLGGYLVEYQSWRLIFFINVPVGLVAAVLGFWLLPRLPRLNSNPFDFWGFVTVAAGLFALLLALSQGPDWGWTGYRVLILLAASVNLLALFVVIELHVERPLIDVRLFRVWAFTNSQMIISVMTAGFFAVLFYIPLFLQEGQHISALHTGFIMFPEAIAMGLTLPISGLLYDKVGPRWPAAIGVTITAFGTYLICNITSDVTNLEVIVWTSLRGIGNALAMVPCMTAGMASVPPEKMDGASAISNVVQRASGALGLAILTSLATAQQAQAMADRSGLLTSAGPAVDPRIAAMQHQGPSGLIPLWEALEVKVQAQVYGNLFLIVASVIAIGIPLALTFAGARPSADRPGGSALEMLG
jgi:EmrB/QacA subfamily drug resistance transporter